MKRIDEELLSLFPQIAAIIRQRHKSIETSGISTIKTSGISMAQARLFRVLFTSNQQLTQKEIAKELSITPQTLSDLIIKTEKQGLIERVQNPQDKRYFFVALTPKGKDKIHEVKAIRNLYAKDILSCLSDEEKEDLTALLTKVVKRNKEKNNNI